MSPPARRAALLLFLLPAFGCGGSLQETKRETVASFEEGKAAFDRGAYVEAILELKAYVVQFPGTDKTDDALYYLGLSYLETKDYPLASGQFDRLIRDFPISPHQPEALFHLAHSDDLQANPAYLDQSETRRALTRYEEFLRLHPDHERAQEARTRISALRDRLAEKKFRSGRLYHKLKYDGAAAIYLRDVIAEYPETAWAGEAALLLAESLVRQGRTREARDALRGVLAKGSTSDDVKRRAELLLRSLPEGAGTP